MSHMFNAGSVVIWALSGDPFNSINIQARLLGDLMIEQGWPEVRCLNSSFLSCRDSLEKSVPSAKLVLWHFGGYDPFLTRRIAKSSNIVMIYHNITPARYFLSDEWKVAAGSILGQMQLSLLPKTVRWLTCSQFNLLQLRSLGFKNIELLPNVVTPPDNSDGQGSKGDRPSLLYVGRIAPNKRCTVLVDAVRWAADEIKVPLDLVLIGRAKQSSREGLRLREKIRELESHPYLRVRWIRDPLTSSQLSAFYRQSTLYVSASEHEGFALPVCEAIVHGVPAIYAPCGGTESILSDLGMVLPAGIVGLGRAIAQKIRCVEERQALHARQMAQVRHYERSEVGRTLRNALAAFLPSAVN